MFKLDPTGDETVLYNFTEEEVQPALSASRLLRDPAGNLYGMARLSTGDLYRMEPDFEVSSQGVCTMLHSFAG